MFALTSRDRRILIVPLTTYERNGWACKELMEFMEHLRHIPGIAIGTGFAHNFTSAAAARNYVCKMVKDMKKDDRPDWVLMIDNDMAPPLDLLKCIDNVPKDAGVVVPRFYMWDMNKANVILCWGMDTKDAPEGPSGSQMFTVKPGGLYELTKAGTGAIFIRSDVMDDLEAPFFFYTHDPHGSRTSTEDINFCIKLRQQTKWKIYGNADFEVGHFHNVNLAQLARWLYAQEVKQSGQPVEELSPAAECFR